MRDFLINNGEYITLSASVAELLIFILLIREYIKKKNTLIILMSLITFGLLWDSSIISLGKFLGGSLGILNRLRFVFHGMLIPLNLTICGYLLKVKKIPLWIVTGAIIIAGTIAGFARHIEPKEFADMLRYVSAQDSPQWAEKIHSILSFATVIPLIITGIIIWIKEKIPFIFLSGFLMFVSSAIGPATGNTDLIFVISMFGEFFMVLFYLMYSKTMLKNENKNKTVDKTKCR